nr:MAG TPA: hypothetical protein [Caudoviricetes sp.]
MLILVAEALQNSSILSTRIPFIPCTNVSNSYL